MPAPRFHNPLLLPRISGFFVLTTCTGFVVYWSVMTTGSFLHLLIAQVVVLLNLMLEPLLSNALWHNIRNMRDRGYTDSQIVAFSLANLVSSTTGNWLALCFLCTDHQSFFDVGQVTLSNVAMILANLMGTEVIFTLLHGVLHTSERWAPYHEFHHLATSPSQTTNLLFHPVDFALEFSGPSLVLYASHQLFQNDFVLAWSLYIMTVWYSWDHDDTLRLPHFAHHTTINSLYMIYGPLKGDPTKNILRRQLAKYIPSNSAAASK